MLFSVRTNRVLKVFNKKGEAATYFKLFLNRHELGFRYSPECTSLVDQEAFHFIVSLASAHPNAEAKFPEGLEKVTAVAILLDDSDDSRRHPDVPATRCFNLEFGVRGSSNHRLEQFSIKKCLNNSHYTTALRDAHANDDYHHRNREDVQAEIIRDRDYEGF